MQDFTGVPAVVDLAAMRDVMCIGYIYHKLLIYNRPWRDSEKTHRKLTRSCQSTWSLTTLCKQMSAESKVPTRKMRRSSSTETSRDSSSWNGGKTPSITSWSCLQGLESSIKSTWNIWPESPFKIKAVFYTLILALELTHTPLWSMVWE